MAEQTRTCVVTGAASGIGFATAVLLAQRGWSVLAVDRDRDRLAELSGTAETLTADVTSDTDCRRISEAAAAFSAPVRGLFNCAGLERHGTVTTLDEASWDAVLAVNLKAIYLVSRHVLPLISAAGGGAIVNMSSVQGVASQPNVGAYAAAKAGVMALTRAMAIDHASESVRVNCVCPGTIDTPLVRENAAYFCPSDPSGQLAEWGRRHPIGRVGRPEEVGELVEFLLSERASFITGATYRVDGGLLASLL